MVFWGLSYNEKYINIGTALCTVLLSAFLLGAHFKDINNKRDSRQKKSKANIVISPNLKTFLYLISAGIILFYATKLGTSYAKVANEKVGVLDTIFICFFIVFFCCNVWKRPENSFYSFYKDFRSIFILTISIILIFLIIGIRSTVIEIILIILCLLPLNLNKQITLVPLLIIICIGTIGISFISFLRLDSSASLVDSFNLDTGGLKSLILCLGDLIINGRNIYIGMEYIDQYGFLYGESFIPNTVSFLPFLPTMVADVLYDTIPQNTTTQYILYKFSNITQLSFYGSQCWIDVYMNFGLILSIIFVFILGMLIQQSLINKDKNILSFIFYIVFCSASIFIVRDSFFIYVRLFFWTWIIYKLFIKTIKINKYDSDSHVFL